MLYEAPPIRNRIDTSAKTSSGRPPKRHIMWLRKLLIAPVASMTVSAPPARKIKNTISPASINPCGIDIRTPPGPTGF